MREPDQNARSSERVRNMLDGALAIRVQVK